MDKIFYKVVDHYIIYMCDFLVNLDDFFVMVCTGLDKITKSSLDKIFYKVVYHHIIYMCDFLVNLDDFFAVVCTGFHENCGLH